MMKLNYTNTIIRKFRTKNIDKYYTIYAKYIILSCLKSIFSRFYKKQNMYIILITEIFKQKHLKLNIKNAKTCYLLEK